MKSTTITKYTPEEHTSHVVARLNEVGAPQNTSHELYWNYRENEPVEEYINRAIKPLVDNGRVPILLTSLDPTRDALIINEIFSSKPIVAKGQTMLVRLCLRSEESIRAVEKIIKSILEVTKKTKKMPTWWPLLQADFDISSWNKLKDALGSDWKYVNIAINPFTDLRVLDEFKDQITVAQFVLGANEDIHTDGNVAITSRCDIGSAINCKRTYNLFEYAQKIKEVGLDPIRIICGPSLPEWNVEYNCSRLEKFLPVYNEAVDLMENLEVSRS